MGKVKKIIPILLALAVGVLGTAGVSTITMNTDEDGDTTVTVQSDFSIELSKEQVPAKIETEDGDIEIIEAPTVESINAENVACDEGEECGKGKYIYAPTETPTAFKDYTLNKCWNTDNHFGAQCWDLGDLYWQNYAGRNLSTCGTGAAKGAWNCKEQNAGNEFVLITDKTKLQAGDWIIFSSGRYGHVGMALGGYNKGYIALLGQNQGGKACDGGGSQTNIINISLNSFSGAFRPKSYIKPDPTPTPTPTPTPSPKADCSKIDVKKGDTLGKIMLKCEGKINWATMNDYAKHWRSIKFKKYPTVYDGWISPNGVGLFAGDTIEKF